MEKGWTKKRSSRGIEILNCVEIGIDPNKETRKQKVLSVPEKLSLLLNNYPDDRHYKRLYNQIKKTGITKRILQMITWEFDNK